jgi:hypothetical protein
VRQFEARSCKPTSRDLPSSLVQHRGATVLAYSSLVYLLINTSDSTERSSIMKIKGRAIF